MTDYNKQIDKIIKIREHFFKIVDSQWVDTRIEQNERIANIIEYWGKEDDNDVEEIVRKKFHEISLLAPQIIEKYNEDLTKVEELYNSLSVIIECIENILDNQYHCEGILRKNDERLQNLIDQNNDNENNNKKYVEQLRKENAELHYKVRQLNAKIDELSSDRNDLSDDSLYDLSETRYYEIQKAEAQLRREGKRDLYRYGGYGTWYHKGTGSDVYLGGDGELHYTM